MRTRVARADALRAAKAYFAGTAERAFKLGVGIDVFCIGHDDFGTTSLVGLTTPSAGSVYLVETASQDDGSTFTANLKGCLGLWEWDTAGQATHNETSDTGWQRDAIIAVQLRVAAPLAVSAAPCRMELPRACTCPSTHRS